MQAPSGSGPILKLGLRRFGPPAGVTFQPSPRADKFTVLGTIEPRKQVDRVINAFEALFDQLNEVELVLVGTMGWASRALTDRISRMASLGSPQFQHYPQADDDAVRQHILESRATVYVSQAEGFRIATPSRAFGSEFRWISVRGMPPVWKPLGTKV